MFWPTISAIIRRENKHIIYKTDKTILSVVSVLLIVLSILWFIFSVNGRPSGLVRFWVETAFYNGALKERQNGG